MPLYLFYYSYFELFHLLCRISIYAGNVILKNLQLKPSALAELDLPVTVKAGLLGSLTLKVPWNNLGRTPVVASIDRLYLLVAPKSEEERMGGVSTAADVDPAFQKAKMARAERQEAKWVGELESLERARQAAQGGGGKDGGGGGGFLRGVIETIIGESYFLSTFLSAVSFFNYTYIYCGPTDMNLVN
jgi:vacuolar protein sorting-associated protein 13A/C